MFKKLVCSLATAGLIFSGATASVALDEPSVTPSPVPTTSPYINDVVADAVPNAPLGLYSTGSGPGYINLSWINPSSNSTAGVLDFVIQYKKNADATWLVFTDGVSTGTTAKVTGLLNSTKYDFRVAAVNASGMSAFTPTASVTSSLSKIPNAPSNVTGTANSNTSVYLSWTAPTVLNGGVLNDYVVLYKLSSVATWSTWNDGTSTTTSTTVTGLTAGAKYQFKIASKSTYGTSAYTSLITVPTVTTYTAGTISTVVGAGDSISRGFDSHVTCALKDCPQYAWSTGQGGSYGDPKSFFTKIKVLNTTANPTTALNVAKTGAKVADLDRQLKLVPTGTKTNVNIMIGANDLCTSSTSTITTTTNFTTAFETALTNYVARNPDAKIFVSSIPNINSLYNLFKTSTTAKAIWDGAKVCPTALATPSTDATRAVVATREAEFNNALKTVCTVKFANNCRWDNMATYNYVFQTSDVSTVDYFHPSITGQASLAATAWKASYWGA